MAAKNYDTCFTHVLGSEGGFTDDPNDKGNWTGCKCDSGVLKGTNWGVSACAYPDLDIRHLTQEQAKEIYHKDYWKPLQSDFLPWGVDLTTFDSGINSGVYQGAKWLQRAVGVYPDGVVGEATLKAASEADDHVTIDRMCDDRLTFLHGLSTWEYYGKGWTARVEDVRSSAHEMVKEHEGVQPAKPEPPLLLNVRIVGPIVLKIDICEEERSP